MSLVAQYRKTRDLIKKRAASDAMRATPAPLSLCDNPMTKINPAALGAVAQTPNSLAAGCANP